MLPQKHINMQIRFIYRYIVYNEKPMYGHFRHILQK